MNAEEMFEKLGYVKRENKGSVLYVKGFGDYIFFEDKRVKIPDVFGYGRVCIDYKLETAIHQQMKELGWI